MGTVPLEVKKVEVRVCFCSVRGFSGTRVPPLQEHTMDIDASDIEKPLAREIFGSPGPSEFETNVAYSSHL